MDFIPYSLDNNHDCLTDAFQSFLWCIKIFFQSLWQVLLFRKEEICYTRNKTINSRDILSMNNSAGGDYRKLPRHHSSKLNRLSNKTRVTIRSISNQNLNRTDSNHDSLTKEKPPSNTLGTINSHITVAPVSSSQCQNRNQTDLNQREQLADALCRRSYEPLTFINRGGMCCGHCRPLIFSNVPFHHFGHYFPSVTPQLELNQEKEQSPQMGDASETQSTQYSGKSLHVYLNSILYLVTPNIQSQTIDSHVDEPLSNDTISNNEQNQSVLSFPEHDTPQSEKLIDDDTQLKLNAQILVDDSIQNAQEKYQKVQIRSILRIIIQLI